ncbi:MAG: carbohydrate ABC transporter permease [Ancrocorticia sp.]|jgi:multiple sugar transport system permease protein|nr:carbohydrate ABC transporter permease [Ancrocorticia sp.]
MMKKHRNLKYTIIGLILLVIMLFPLYWMINVSFTQTKDMRRTPPYIFPIHPTLDGYRDALSDQLPHLLTSVGIGLGCVLITLLIALPAGYALARLAIPGKKTLNFVLLVAQMIPSVVMAMGFYAIYVRVGMLNTVWGLIIADSTIAVPFGVMLFTTYMMGIPRELLEAAKIDGASVLRTFLSIVIPLSKNTVVTVSLFAFLWGWSDFIFASTVDRNGTFIPITLGIYQYIGNNTTSWNSIMATAVIASIPAAILLVIAQKYVAAGVTAGAVKD